MIRLQLQLDPPRESLYEEAIARLHDVELTGSDGDAVITGSPSHAAESSVPVLLDEPESCSRDELQSLTSARLMPAHEWRFLPGVAPVHQSLAAGKLGDPGLLRIHHWLTDQSPPREAAFGQIDLAHWFFGAPPSRTHVLNRPDYLQLHLGFPDHGMALIDLAANRPGDHPYYSMHLIGSTGAAYADDHRNAHLLFDQNGSRALLHEQNHLLGIQNMLSEFLAGITENRPWSVGLNDTIDTLNTIEEASHV